MRYALLVPILTGLLMSFLVIGPVKAELPTVAVFDFDIGSTISLRLEESGSGGYSSKEVEASAKTNLLTNKLITKLTQSDAVSVVERDEIARIMEELALSEAELTSPENAIQMGKLLGADYLVFGSIDALEPNVVIEDLPYDAGKRKSMSLTAAATARLVHTETGKIEAAEDIQAVRRSKQTNPPDLSRSIPVSFQRSVLDDLVEKISDRLVNAMSPIKVATHSGDTVYLARGRMSEGEKLEVVMLGETIVDPDNPDKVLGQVEERIAIIEVTDGLESMSKARVMKWVAESQKIPSGSIARAVD